MGTQKENETKLTSYVTNSDINIFVPRFFILILPVSAVFTWRLPEVYSINKSVLCCEGKATPLSTLEYASSHKTGTRAGRKLIRHIKCVRLQTPSYKVSAYQNKPGVITISLTGNEPTKSLFSVNSIINTSSSDFKSKSINVIVHPRRNDARALLRSINFLNLHVIDSLRDDKKVEVSLTV